MPAAFPGRAALVQAQSGWCDMLVKTKLAGADATGSCKSAIPTSSPAFLKGMTKCFAQRIESYGESVPDKGIIVAECKEETQFNIPADDAGGVEVIDARCQRMLKCEKIAVAECKASVMKLESSQRAIFTSVYNGPSLHNIAECLSSKSCTENEDEAREGCYKPATEKLVWFSN